MKSLYLKHQTHLKNLNELSSKVTPLVSFLAKVIWDKIWKMSNGKISAPNVEVVSESIFYLWEKDDHRFEIKIHHGRDPELFYENKNNGESWSGNYETSMDEIKNTIYKMKENVFYEEDLRRCLKSYKRNEIGKREMISVFEKLVEFVFYSPSYHFPNKNPEELIKETAEFCVSKVDKCDEDGKVFNFFVTITGCFLRQAKRFPRK